MVVPDGSGGVVDTELAGLRSALAEAFEVPHMRRRIAKLAAASQSERHLFMAVDGTGLSDDSVSIALISEAVLPPEPPPLPAA